MCVGSLGLSTTIQHHTQAAEGLLLLYLGKRVGAPLTKGGAPSGQPRQEAIEDAPTWFRVSGFGFRDSGFGFFWSRVLGSEFRVLGSGFRISGSGFRISSFWFLVWVSEDDGLKHLPLHGWRSFIIQILGPFAIAPVLPEVPTLTEGIDQFSAR